MSARALTTVKRSNKVTAILPESWMAEAEEVVEGTGVSLQDLLRQGMVRVLREVRESGGVVLVDLKPREGAAA